MTSKKQMVHILQHLSSKWANLNEVVYNALVRVKSNVETTEKHTGDFLTEPSVVIPKQPKRKTQNLNKYISFTTPESEVLNRTMVLVFKWARV